ncbi:MAG: putative bifunctional diguanylate cyclase/phosphodiesterase [Thermoanaerobaculia bacterium]
MSRPPSIWSLPLLPLVAALFVALAAIGLGLASAGLSQRQAVAGGALLVALLVAAVLATVWRRPPDRGRPGEPPDRARALPGLRSLDRLAGRLAAAERPAGIYEAGLHDPLTRLPGRALLEELLHKQVAQARRSGELVGLILCDIDDLKAINESYGHRSGDLLLQEVARRLSSDIREADSVARTGEDEFTLVVGRAESAADIRQVAERLIAGIRAPVEVEGQEMLISASVGVSVFPQDAEQSEQLLDTAETALAAAKSQGGDSVRVYSADMGHGGRRRGALGQALRRALRRQELCLHFQPQVSLVDGRIIGMEALVRWPHAEKGLISAGVFIPVAEASGLMPELGRWLMAEVCRQNAAWCDSGLARLPVSVNVSGRQFQGEEDLAGVVEEALDASGLPAELLHLEITESIALEDFERISKTLSRLRERGVRIHLDDFGTGFSSLSYLLRFPVDVLKIDRSFVTGMPASHHGATIVRATLSLADSLGLGVIVEGVEERDQLRFLRAAGCQVVQGYLLGRPAPVDEFEALLGRGRVDLASVTGDDER